MASKLLNVLTNIENDRRYLIDVANNAGYSISENAKLRQLDATIRAIEVPTEIPSNGIPDEWIIKENWVRPLEWPDCHQILLDTPINGTHIPYMILLLKDSADEIELARSLISISSNTTTDAIAYSAILTSDGVFYNNQNETRTHTWDKSKDIIVTDGEYPGTYRWLLYYGTLNGTYSGAKWLRNMQGVVECILDCSRFSTQSSYGYSPIVFYGASSKSIINVEVFDVENVSMQVSNGNPYIYGFSGCTELRNLDFHGCSGVMTNSTSTGGLFADCRKLQNIDLSNIRFILTGSSTGYYDLSNCYSLRSFKGPITTQSQASYSIYMYYIKLGYNPYLKLLQTDLRDNTDGYVQLTLPDSWQRSYVPEDIAFIGEYYGSALPYNWNGHSYFGNKMFSDSAYPKTSTNTPSFYPNSATLFREVIDLTNVLSYTNDSSSFGYSVYSSSANSTISIPYTTDNYITPYLSNSLLLFPQDTCVRLRFYSPIGKQNILSLFDVLKDLSSEERTVTNPRITLYYSDYNSLTPEEIAIATNKGWTVGH